MEMRDPLASLAFDVRRCHDWRPAGNFALNQYREWLLTSCGLGRYIGAEVEQTLTHAGGIQCLVDGIAERVANRLRRALGGKQRKPRCRLEFWQPSLFRRRAIRNGRVTFGGPDGLSLAASWLNLGGAFRNPVRAVVNLAAQQRIRGRTCPGEWHQCRTHAQE